MLELTTAKTVSEARRAENIVHAIQWGIANLNLCYLPGKAFAIDLQAQKIELVYGSRADKDDKDTDTQDTDAQ